MLQSTKIAKQKVENIVGEVSDPITPEQMQTIDVALITYGRDEVKLRWLMNKIHNHMLAHCRSILGIHGPGSEMSRDKQKKDAKNMWNWIVRNESACPPDVRRKAEKCPDYLKELAQYASRLILVDWDAYAPLMQRYAEIRKVLVYLAREHPVYQRLQELDHIYGVGEYTFACMAAQSGNLHAFHSRAAFPKYAGTVPWRPEVYGATKDGTTHRGHRELLHAALDVLANSFTLRNPPKKYQRMFRERLEYEKNSDKPLIGGEWRRVKELRDAGHEGRIEPDLHDRFGNVRKNWATYRDSNGEIKGGLTAKEAVKKKKGELWKLARRYCMTKFTEELYDIWTSVAPETPRARARREKALAKKRGKSSRKKAA